MKGGKGAKGRKGPATWAQPGPAAGAGPRGKRFPAQQKDQAGWGMPHPGMGPPSAGQHNVPMAPPPQRWSAPLDATAPPFKPASQQQQQHQQGGKGCTPHPAWQGDQFELDRSFAKGGHSRRQAAGKWRGGKKGGAPMEQPRKGVRRDAPGAAMQWGAALSHTAAPFYPLPRLACVQTEGYGSDEELEAMGKVNRCLDTIFEDEDEDASCERGQLATPALSADASTSAAITPELLSVTSSVPNFPFASLTGPAAGSREESSYAASSSSSSTSSTNKHTATTPPFSHNPMEGRGGHGMAPLRDDASGYHGGSGSLLGGDASAWDQPQQQQQQPPQQQQQADWRRYPRGYAGAPAVLAPQECVSGDVSVGGGGAHIASVLLNGLQLVTCPLPRPGCDASVTMKAETIDVVDEKGGLGVDIIFIASQDPAHGFEWRASLECRFASGDPKVYFIGSSRKADVPCSLGRYIKGVVECFTVYVTQVPTDTPRRAPQEPDLLELLEGILTNPQYNKDGGSISSVQIYNIIKESPLYGKVIRDWYGGSWMAFIKSSKEFTVFAYTEEEVKKWELGPRYKRGEPRICLSRTPLAQVQASDRMSCYRYNLGNEEILQTLVATLKENGPSSQRDILNRLRHCKCFTDRLYPTRSLLERFISQHKNVFELRFGREQPLRVGLKRPRSAICFTSVPEQCLLVPSQSTNSLGSSSSSDDEVIVAQCEGGAGAVAPQQEEYDHPLLADPLFACGPGVADRTLVSPSFDFTESLLPGLSLAAHDDPAADNAFEVTFNF